MGLESLVGFATLPVPDEGTPIGIPREHEPAPIHTPTHQWCIRMHACDSPSIGRDAEAAGIACVEMALEQLLLLQSEAVLRSVAHNGVVQALANDEFLCNAWQGRQSCEDSGRAQGTHSMGALPHRASSACGAR